MSNAREMIDRINAMSAMVFMDDPGIQKNFVDKNMKIKGVSFEDAQMFCDQQAISYKKVIQNSWKPDKPENYLGKCTTFSHYATFMDMAVYGDILSFNPDDKLVYVELGNYKSGRTAEGQDLWEKRAKLILSPYGELAIRMDYGQIKYADPVVVVREGDQIQLGTDERGNVRAIWSSAIVGKESRKIIASFVKITRPDDSFVTTYLLQEDIDRLAGYSKKKNKTWVNPLYGAGENGQGIDSGFLKAKTLKHSFGVFPKVRLRGTNSNTEDLEETGDEVPESESFALKPERPAAIHAMALVPEQASVNIEDDWDKPSLRPAVAGGPTTAGFTPEFNEEEGGF